nr:hypothetical protein [Rubrobacter marinus]
MALVGKTGTRPKWAFIPKTPQSDDGMRMEPPPSVPRAKGVTPAATEVAAPALEPPAVLEVSHALRVTPVSGLSPAALQPNSVVVVLPTMHAPAARTRSTEGASAPATFSAMSREPKVVLTPPTLIRSFTERGSPCSGPNASPRASFASASPAAASASSGVGVTKAFRVGSRASMRAMLARTASTAETSPFAIAERSSRAVP